MVNEMINRTKFLRKKFLPIGRDLSIYQTVRSIRLSASTLMFLSKDLVAYLIILPMWGLYGTFNRDLLKILQQVRLIETVLLIETLEIFNSTVTLQKIKRSQIHQLETKILKNFEQRWVLLNQKYKQAVFKDLYAAKGVFATSFKKYALNRTFNRDSTFNRDIPLYRIVRYV